MAARYVAPAILLAALLAGCGGSSGSPSGGSSAGNPYSTAKPVVVDTPKSGVRSTMVTIVTGSGGKYAFSPKTLTVKAGTLITFKNDTQAPHTVNFTGNATLDKSVQPGQSVTLTISRGGSFAYHCTIHPYMRAAIIVRQA